MNRIFNKSISRTLSVILAFVLCITTVFVASAVAEKIGSYKCLYDEIIAKKGFIYGVNSPWAGDTSSGLGGSTESELLGNGRTHVSVIEDYRRILTNCKAIGYDAVKIWLFKGMDGVRITEYGDVLGFDEYFWDDFYAVMDMAQEIGIAIDLTLLPHQETFLGEAYKYGTEGQMLYNAITQCVVNPEYRQHYIDRIVTPLCKELDKKYRDTILSITVYCEPEGDIYGEGDVIPNNYTYGTSWGNLVEFMNEVSDCVRKNLPNVPITATSGFNPYHAYRYNEVDLDIIGVDVYNKTGNLPDPEAMMVNKPMWATEFGPEFADGNYNHSDDFQIQYMLEFYNNAIDLGYTGAFFWTYNGYPPMSVTYTQSAYSSLRPVAAVLHYRFIDEELERKGIETGSVADRPAILYGDDSLTLQWIASRDAKSYKVEVSYNDGKNYETYVNISDAESVTGSNNICSYDISEIKQGNDATFRISVVTNENLEAVSEPLTMTIPKYTCSDGENLIKNSSFENDLDNWVSSDKNECAQSVNAETAGSVRNGDYALELPGDKENHLWCNVGQKVSLKANTTYRVTFYSKHLWDKYTKNFKVQRADGSTYLEKKIAIGNDYVINTYTFTTGDKDEDVTVYFVNNYEKIYIDSVYLFETDE